MHNSLDNLMSQYPQRVREALNVLIESPYFYRTDKEDVFFFLRRHKAEFANFFELYFGWKFIIDDKCARVHKTKWYNPAIGDSQRDIFNFRRRDECLAFMMLLEFFEHQLDEHSITVEDHDNLRFQLGDLLLFITGRFAELFPEHSAQRYTEEKVRKNILRPMMPVLERYRFVEKVPPPGDMGTVAENDLIYEALPALFHYNTTRLFEGLDFTESTEDEEDEAEDAG